MSVTENLRMTVEMKGFSQRREKGEEKKPVL